MKNRKRGGERDRRTNSCARVGEARERRRRTQTWGNNDMDSAIKNGMFAVQMKGEEEEAESARTAVAQRGVEGRMISAVPQQYAQCVYRLLVNVH